MRPFSHQDYPQSQQPSYALQLCSFLWLTAALPTVVLPIVLIQSVLHQYLLSKNARLNDLLILTTPTKMMFTGKQFKTVMTNLCISTNKNWKLYQSFELQSIPVNMKVFKMLNIYLKSL